MFHDMHGKLCYDIDLFVSLDFSGTPIPRMEYTEQEIKTW